MGRTLAIALAIVAIILMAIGINADRKQQGRVFGFSTGTVLVSSVFLLVASGQLVLWSHAK